LHPTKAGVRIQGVSSLRNALARIWYDILFQEIRQLIDTAKQRAAVAVNAEIILLYEIEKRMLPIILLMLPVFGPIACNIKLVICQN
jgi:hypothetical protein